MNDVIDLCGELDFKMGKLERRMKFVEENSIAGLRDFFATSALSALSNTSVIKWSEKEVASYCYKMADAMLKEREKKV
jgi:hypothetical protein